MRPIADRVANANAPMHASVIIPTSGRPQELGRTLESILSQDAPACEHEVLVVENGEKGGAERVVRRALRERPRSAVRYLHDATPGLLSGRHRGALEARGEILVFVDDDIDATQGWLQSIVGTFGASSVHLVGGRNLPQFEVEPPAWLEGFWYTPPHGGRACIYLSLLDLGEAELQIDANYVWGLNFAIRRATLFELGGFHPDNIADELQQFQGDGETGLTMKANERGLRAIYQPKARIHHRIPASRLTAEYFCRRAFYQGVCDSFTAVRRDPEPIRQALQAATRPAMPRRGAIGGRSSAAGWQRGFLWRLLAPTRRASAPGHEEVATEVQSAYRAGYEFHQTAVRSDPRLLDWVLRDDYWDYKLPDLSAEVAVRSVSEESALR